LLEAAEAEAEAEAEVEAASPINTAATAAEVEGGGENIAALVLRCSR
jgi:hypothetical protein